MLRATALDCTLKPTPTASATVARHGAHLASVLDQQPYPAP
jgi:hypothetical protein